MTELLGNGMHVDRIGLAVGLAVSFVSAQPIPNERKVYVRLVVEMAADHGSIYGHCGCTRPGAQEEGGRQRKGHRQEARYCTKKVSQNQKRPKKKEARRKSPKKPAHLCPSSAISTCGRLVGTRVQLMLGYETCVPVFVLELQTGFRKGLLAATVRLPIQDRISISSGVLRQRRQ